MLIIIKKTAPLFLTSDKLKQGYARDEILRIPKHVATHSYVCTPVQINLDLGQEHTSKTAYLCPRKCSGNSKSAKRKTRKVFDLACLPQQRDCVESLRLARVVYVENRSFRIPVMFLALLSTPVTKVGG